MSLQQLIYTSAATKEMSELELSRILLGARRRNAALGVTGMLLYDDGSFLQVLEGDAANVQILYDRIAGDPRHCRLRQLLRRSIEARQFNEWSMGFVDMKGVALGLPGYSDYLRKRSDPAQAGSLAEKVLAQFCGGELRNLVNAR